MIRLYAFKAPGDTRKRWYPEFQIIEILLETYMISWSEAEDYLDSLPTRKIKH